MLHTRFFLVRIHSYMVKAVDTITGLKKPDPGNSCLSPARPDRRTVEIGPEPEKARLGPTGPA